MSADGITPLITGQTQDLMGLGLKEDIFIQASLMTLNMPPLPKCKMISHLGPCRPIKNVCPVSMDERDCSKVLSIYIRMSHHKRFHPSFLHRIWIAREYDKILLVFSTRQKWGNA